nr:protein quirky [Quercus suber]
MVRKLIVEVVDARNLTPKDGHGTSSPFVQVDYYGQRKRTKTAICELNPTWNEVLEFNVAKPSDAQVLGDMLEVVIYHDKNHGPTTRNNFLGWIRLDSTQLFVKKGEEVLIYFPLQKKSLLSWIQGDIGLKIYYVDLDENEVVPPPPPPEPEKKQEEPPAVAASPPPEPAPAPPAADGEKPNEEPPAAAAEAAAAPPPENAEAEPEKPTESSQPPPQPVVEEPTPPDS